MVFIHLNNAVMLLNWFFQDVKKKAPRICWQKFVWNLLTYPEWN